MWKLFFKICAGLLLAALWALPVRASEPVAASAEIKTAFGPPARVALDEGLADLTPHIRFAPGFDGSLTTENLAAFTADASFDQSNISNYGSPGTRFLLTLAVTNVGTEAGSWQLLTKRAGLPELTFAEFRNGQVNILRDRRDPDLGQHLRTNHGFVHPFELAAGETRYFVVTFRGFHSSSLPLVIADPTIARQQQYFKIATITASVASMLVLMLVATLFYLVTSGRHYLWLAFAELNHAAFVVHVNGYSVHYWLHDKGILIYALGWAIPCIYGLAMVQFTRGLLGTSENLPRVDRLLKWLAVLLAATLLLIFVAAIGSFEGLLQLAGYPVPVSLTIYTFGLPIVGAIAVARLGKQYMPLLLAWAIMALFSAYFTIAMLDLGFRLPFDAYSYGPIGVIVSLLMTLTMVLHMRQVTLSQQQSERDLIVSLEDQLRLSEDKANALATITDQDNLIHASGHDSQQVMLALNAIVDFAESDELLDIPPALTQTLKASVKQLEDIADTTMAGPFSTGDNLSLVMLGRFELRDLLRQTEMIYRPLVQRKGLQLTIADPGDLRMISDRAICARILSNLLSNCAKYTDKGSVTVEVTAEENEVAISFCDTGQGMAPDFVARLLDSEAGRNRVNHTIDGSGSGFAAALKATRLLGGKLSVDSTPRQGTTVSISLPMISSDVECSIDLFIAQAGQQGIPVLDIDNMQDLKTADVGDRLVITSDPTANNRNRLSSLGSVALLRPVSFDMLRHPLIQKDAAT